MLGLGRYNSMGIGLAITLRDNFSNTAQRINTQIQNLTGNAQKAMSANFGAMRGMGLSMMLMGGAYLSFIKSSVQESAKFNYILKGIEATSDAVGISMDEMKKKAIEIGSDSKFTIDEVAESMRELGMAGFNRKQVLSMIRPIASLAADDDLPMQGAGGAADILARTIHTYDLAASSAGHVSDLIAKAAVESASTVRGFGETLKYASAEAVAYGVKLEDVLAMTMKLSNMGVRDSQAGVYVSNMLRFLAKASSQQYATKKERGALASLGLAPQNLRDAHNNLLPVTALLDILFKSSRKLSQTELGVTLNQIVGERGSRALVPLLRDAKNTKNFVDFLKDLQGADTQGYSDRLAAKRMDNLQGDIMKMSSMWHQFKVEMGDFPGLRLLVQGATTLLHIMLAIVRNPIGKFFASIAVVVAGLVFVFGGLSFVIGTIGSMLQKTTASFTMMGRSAAWAYNQASASAFRFATVQNVVNNGSGFRYAAGTKVNGVNVGGRYAPTSSFANGNSFLGNLGIVGQAGQGLFGMSTKMLKFVKVLGWAGIAIDLFYNVITGKFMTGISTLLGGLVGAFFGGLPGAMLGAGLGGIVGSFFESDKKSNSVPVYSNGQISESEFGTKYLGWKDNGPSPQTQDINQTINVNVDGYPSISKKINGTQDEDIYSTIN